MADDRFKVVWHDRGREPQCAPDPAFPDGRDLDMTDVLVEGWPTCRAELPYPAKRCGIYVVECKACGLTVGITTAGRPDDPRSVRVGCRKPDKQDVH